MVANSKIEWTDHTFNPWWGCTRVSPACEHCYAEAFAKRTGHKVWGPTSERRLFGQEHWDEPAKWNAAARREGVRRRVFSASMADVFEVHRDRGTNTLLDVERRKLWRLIEETPHLDWLLLTKRPENVMRLAAPEWTAAIPANVWIGTTVEDKRRANERIPELLKIPARVRFLSCEPLLEEVNLEEVASGSGLACSALGGECWGDCECDAAWGPESGCRRNGGDGRLQRKVHWVIIGGESGGGARSLDLTWARSVVEQCRDAHVPVFVKQLGAKPDLGVVRLRDRKGGDWTEWPADLRVREFPEAQP